MERLACGRRGVSRQGMACDWTSDSQTVIIIIA